MAEVSQEDIHRALMARVEALSLVPAPLIIYPGYPSPQAEYWLRVTHLPNVPDRIGVNATTSLDHRGIMQLDLMNEMGRHEVVYINRAQSIIAQFPQDLKLVQGTARVLVVKSYSLGGRATGDHWMLPVRVEYRALPVQP